jgi:hypothetical protein
VTNSEAVTVYSYPAGKLVGTLSDAYVPQGECVDKSGDVYVTDSGNGVVEYRHGARNPLRTLEVPVSIPVFCAIDPSNGDLAVSGLGAGPGGGIAIYKGATGTPKVYRDRHFWAYYGCAFDDKGDLLIDGQAYPNDFLAAELPKKSRKFRSIDLTPTILWPGGVQWDGKDFAVGDQAAPAINRYSVSGGSGNEVGHTQLGSGANDIFQFYILGSRVIAPNEAKTTQDNDVLYFRWPAGGRATKTITNGVRFPRGAVVSLAQK